MVLTVSGLAGIVTRVSTMKIPVKIVPRHASGAIGSRSV
jgi:preprotein translocase subunit YajC